MSTIHVTMLGRFSVTVDGREVDASSWSRRHPAALVKVLALAPGRRLHREQVVDLLWPDDTVDEAVPKLHKAAHYARRALAVADAIVLRADHVLLAPDHVVHVDAVDFDELSRRAIADGDVQLARRALALHGGDLLPDDRYDEWAVERREQVRLRHIDLLRLDDRWDEVVELEPGDEAAHVALMRRHVGAGDRHAALRQFERLDRTLRRELGVAPGREAVALRDRLVVERDASSSRDDALVGRDAERVAADDAVAEVLAGRGRTLIVTGPAGVGKSSFVDQIARTARERGMRLGTGTSAPVEGAWPYAPIIEALADLCRRHPTLLDGLPDQHREEIDRALSGAELTWTGGSTHQRLFVATAELIRLAAASTGVLLSLDDVHDADDASLRLIHYIARSSQGQRVCIVLAHRPSPLSEALVDIRRSLLARQAAVEIDLGPLAPPDTERIVRRHVADPSQELLDRIGALSGGIPFAVNELARRAATEPAWVQSLDANMIGGISPSTREVLQRVAIVGTSFDTDEFVALSGLSEADAFARLDDALGSRLVEHTDVGYRFRHRLVRDALLEDVPPHRRRVIHRDAAHRLLRLGASAARVGHHLLHAGETAAAVPHLLRAAETEAAVGAYRDALALVDAVRPYATNADRARTLSLRADLLNAVGDPMAASAYRDALDGAPPEDRVRLRTRLARASLMAGDIDTASAALDGLETDGGPLDSEILLERGKIAFFRSDLAGASAAADEAEARVLAGERSWQVLDLVSLQGLLAHLSGNWFDRIRLELRRTRDNPEIANAIFDGHLCAAEYLLYGPTPYAEVIAIAQDLRATAQRSGALRAAAFASALIGEAALLSGDLTLAVQELEEASALHHDLGSSAGESHSLQRLAEVRLAQGDRIEAMRLLEQSMPLARWSFIARHLLQRIFGTMIRAAPDPITARAIVDRAESTIGSDDACIFCSVMLAIPATIACAEADDLVSARRHLESAEACLMLWQGTSWEAGLSEARAAVAAAEGDAGRACEQLALAAAQFDRCGQPLDAARCRAGLEPCAV